MSKDVFISYRRNNGHDLALSLKREIERDIYTCFVDTEDLSTGIYKDKIMNNIKECKLMVIIITEGYLEKCCEENDICLQEISTAIKTNKEISIVTNVKRKKIRYILDRESTPKVLKGLKDINMLEVDNEHIDEIIKKLLKSLGDIDRDIYLKYNSEINQYNENRSIKAISNKTFKNAGKYYGYYGDVVSNKLSGNGVILGLMNGMIIEGYFDCEIYVDCETKSIQGKVKIYEQEQMVFSGEVEEIESIEGLKLTGNGIMKSENNISEGRFVKGDLDGKGTTKDLEKGIFYRGIFKNGKRSGKGILVIRNNETDLRIRTSFCDDKINGDLYIEDMNTNIEYIILKDSLDKLKESLFKLEVDSFNSSEEIENEFSINIILKEISWRKLGIEVDESIKDKLNTLDVELKMIDYENENENVMIQNNIEGKYMAAVNIENNIVSVGLSYMIEDTYFLRIIDYNTENITNGFEIENGYIRSNDKYDYFNNIEIGQEEAKLLFNAESKKYIVSDDKKERVLKNHKAMEKIAEINYLLDKEVRKIIKKLIYEIELIK